MFIWYGAGALAAIAIAWLAALVHASGHAPIGLVSLAVGIAIGFAIVKITTALQVAKHRRNLIIGAILFAIVAILSYAAETAATARTTLDAYNAAWAAYNANPHRFHGRRPTPPKIPTVAWINDPSREALIHND